MEHEPDARADISVNPVVPSVNFTARPAKTMRNLGFVCSIVPTRERGNAAPDDPASRVDLFLKNQKFGHLLELFAIVSDG